MSARSIYTRPILATSKDGPGNAAVLLECQLSHLVNEAYGLTPDEVALLWESPRRGCRLRRSMAE